MKYVLDFLIYNSIHLVVTIAMIIIMHSSTVTAPYHKRIFSALLILNTVFLVTDYTDTTIRDSVISAQLLPLFSKIRMYAVAITYCLKALELLLLVFALLAPKRKLRLYLTFPAVFACFLSVSSIFTKWLYDITPENIYVSGSLKWLYMTIVFSYFLILPFLTLDKKNNGNPVQFITIVLITLLLTFTTLMGLLYSYRFNLLGMSIVVCTMLYFLFDFMQRSNMVIEDKEHQLQMQQIELVNSQIQPHFLYNTLSIVCGLCQQNPVLAEKTLVDFSNYLRGNLHYGKAKEPMITVEKELEHTRYYTNIEQTRFRHLTVQYDIQDGSYFLPFLTIQPIVENAIRHGVRGLPGGTVTISLCAIRQDDKTIHCITVQDNGTGKPISQELDDHKGIGIPNVKNRLESLCHGSLETSFTPNGTTVKIQIPAFVQK